MHGRLLLLFLLACLLVPPVFGGPPFLTDDPEPVDYHHWEAYLFSTVDKGNQNSYIEGPAVEVNAGVAPNLQLHLVIPAAFSSISHGPSGFGLGDVELGAKYRFIQEKGHHPQVGIFPMLELPTGDAALGLGNGRLWARLPIWLQKSWGPWTSYGGGGYVINPAAGMRDYPFGGWLVQRNLSKRLTLGGEVFAQGATSVGGRSVTIFNAGGFYNFNSNFSLLFTAGHTVAGESHTVGYLGLYWTWGP